ncbi:hypothetical protein MKX03_019575, partial [Papaver bracteatum]
GDNGDGRRGTESRDNNDKRRRTKYMQGNNSDGGGNTTKVSPTRIRTNRDNDDEKEDFEQARPWDILGDDLVWFLSSNLSPLDYVHLRAVCRNYRLVFLIGNWRRICSTRSLKTTLLSPWLVFSKDNESVYSFTNPVHNDENYLTSIPKLLKGSTIQLMSKGHYGVFFYNPFTKAFIKPPNLPDDCNYIFR